jgi:PucR family transcriptional regulator, purine catabolism regulatory protein
MGITLQNALKIGKFAECEVVAGHKGLSKIVENITIMEVPNIVKWLKGKELLLTSLYSVKDDEDAQGSLIQSLYDAGVTALAIKPFNSLESIPEVIVRSADQLGFPVIKIPEQVKYLDILSPVMHAIFDDKIVIQEDLEQASHILNEISLNSQGIDVFINTLGYLTKNVITIDSRFPFRKMPKPDVEISPLTQEEIYELGFIKHPIRLKRKYGDEMVSCIVAPVIVDGQLYGNITCWEMNSDFIGIDIAILEKASTLLALEFLRLKVQYDIEHQYKNDFMRELLFNESMNEKDLIEWGEKYHLSSDKKYICMLLSGEKNSLEFEKLMKLNEVDYIIQKRWKKVIVGRIRNFICIIFPLEELGEQSFKLHCETLFNHLKYYSGSRFEARMGVGRVNHGVNGIRSSYFQAEQAIKLGISTKAMKEVIYYDDLGVYRLLNLLAGEKELNDFYKETVGKLAEYDLNHDLNLVETLRMYVHYDENLKVTSQKMFIHVNTLKYRIQKIELLTGYSLHNTDGKMMLYVGLKIHEMLG